MKQLILPFFESLFITEANMPKNKKKRRATLDDGCSSELVKGAQFDGNFGIPFMQKPKRIIIPTSITSFN